MYFLILNYKHLAHDGHLLSEEGRKKKGREGVKEGGKEGGGKKGGRKGERKGPTCKSL